MSRFLTHPNAIEKTPRAFLISSDEPTKWYREFITQAPEEMSGFLAMMTVPPGPPFPEELHLRKMCAIVWCYQGSLEQAESILEPIRSYRPPAFQFFVPMPFPMLQGMFDPIYPVVCNGTGRRISSRNSAMQRLRSISNTLRRCRPGNRLCIFTR